MRTGKRPSETAAPLTSCPKSQLSERGRRREMFLQVRCSVGIKKGLLPVANQNGAGVVQLLSHPGLPIRCVQKDFGVASHSLVCAQKSLSVRIEEHWATSLDLGSGFPGHDQVGLRPDPNALLPGDQ